MILFMNSFLFSGIDFTAPGTPSYFFEVVEIPTFVKPLAIHWASSWFVFLSVVFTSSSSFQCNCCGSFVSLLDIFLYDFITVFLLSCKLLITTVWAPWASTFLAKVSTFSLCMVILSSHFVSSLIISASISSSLKPCI